MLKASQKINLTYDEEINTQFTFEEYNDIQNRINVVKEKVAELNITKEQLNALNSKLDYITEKAKTMGRIDWKNLVIGTILGTLMQIALPPNTIKTIWLIIQEIFNGILMLTIN